MNNNYIEQKKNTHLYFQVGNNKYAVNTDNVLEIMKLPALDYPSKLPNNIVGLLKYNNFVINIIDIRFYLDIEASKYTYENDLLIVKTDETIFGIITDKILGIIPFETLLIDQIPFVNNNMIIESLYKYNEEETIFIVNVYAIERLLKSHSATSPEIDMQAMMPQDETSKAILAKRAHDMVEKTALRLAAGGRQIKNKYISINLNKDYYCIPLDYIREILNNTNITNIPGTPDFIKGIMNLRGDYITVVDLKKFLGLPELETEQKNSVVIIDCNDLKLALLVDNINEIFEMEDMQKEASTDSYYSFEFIKNTALYTVLNIEKIATDKRLIITDM